MSLTITIPGAVEATTGAVAPAILTVEVGTPGATGPQGPAGPGVPVGGTAGQFLTKIDGTNYNTDWTTVNLSQYAVKANNLSDLASASTARTNLGLGTMATATAANYSTTAAADLLYAPIAAGQPASGTVGQVLTKNSGTNYDSSWATLVPGDRYLTSSTTSLSVANGAKTLTVGTGLSYSPQQDVIIAYDSAHHMHAVVTTYDSSTGVMVVNVQSHTGSGTFALWTVNVGGTTPLQSVYWGEILGTLGDQSDLATALNDKLELSGGALDVNSTITASTATVNSLFAGDTFGVELTANPSENASLQYNGVQVQNAIGSMLVTASGLTFPNSSTQTVAFPGFTGYAALAGATFTGEVSTPASTTSSAGLSILPGTAPTSPVNGEFWNTGTDLQVRLGGVTETLAEQSWVTSQGYLTSSALTPYAPLAGATFTGLVTTVAASAATAGLNVPHTATAPSSPVNGDIWSTTAGLFARINAGTKQLMTLSDTQTVSGSITFSNASQTLGNSTATGTINVASGATISASTKTLNIGTGGVVGSTTTTIIGPVLGASTTTIGGTTAASTLNLATGATLTATTKAVNIGTAGVAGSTTTIAIGTVSGGTSTTTMNGTTAFAGPITGAINNISLGSGTAAQVMDFATGVTATGLTKAVSIGTGGAAGSTTTISLGATAGTSTTTLNGTTNGVTAAADTNSVALATTAFVVGQASSTAPAATGTAAVGTSLKYARADHVHVNPLPTGGTAGQVLSKVDATSYNVQWSTPSGGGSGADVQTFTTAGTATWTKPSGKTMAWVRVFGAGSGGGSGARQATTIARSGGGGGGPGGFVEAWIPVSLLGATETVTVGAGGAGGTAVSVDSTNGNNGSFGGDSTFSIFRGAGNNGANGGGAGGGATAAAGATTSSGYVTIGFSTAGTASNGGAGNLTTGGSATAISQTIYSLATAAGGGGGAAASSVTTANGGSGAGKQAASASGSISGLTSAVAGGTAGNATTPTAPTTGTSGVARYQGGTGGGGGGYKTATAGQAGAAGAQPGGGGGGGGASDNGFASGAGGAGGDGMVIVVCY